MSLVNKALSSTALISVGLLAQVGGAVSLFAAETDGEQTKGAAIAALGLATASVGMLMDAPRPRRSQLRWAAVNPHRVMGALFRAGGGKDLAKIVSGNMLLMGSVATFALGTTPEHRIIAGGLGTGGLAFAINGLMGTIMRAQYGTIACCMLDANGRLSQRDIMSLLLFNVAERETFIRFLQDAPTQFPDLIKKHPDTLQAVENELSIFIKGVGCPTSQRQRKQLIQLGDICSLINQLTDHNSVTDSEQ